MPGSTPRGNDLAEAQRLACLLIGHIDEDVRTELARDAWGTIVSSYGIPVSYHPATASQSCSIDGLYTPDPPSISIARAASTPRESFSLLHELGHHLQRRNLDIAAALARIPVKLRSAMAEDVCDAFAAELLLPSATVARILDGTHPSGSVLRRLYQGSEASRAACCVRLAQTMVTEGYAVLADQEATINFVARAHAEYRVGRGVHQSPDGVIARAIRSGSARDKDRLTYASGWRSGLYYADATFDGQWVYAVFQTRPPSTWAIGLLTEDERRPRPPELECPHCTSMFEAWAKACEQCGQVACTDCSRCGCVPRAMFRTCQGCWLQKPVAQFAGDNPICEDCGG